MKLLKSLLPAFCILSCSQSLVTGTVIRETLEPPSTPGNAYSGTFFVTPSEPIWALGVGNDLINDTSISGIAFIDGLEANDHWVSALISKASWELGLSLIRSVPLAQVLRPRSLSIHQACPGNGVAAHLSHFTGSQKQAKTPAIHWPSCSPEQSMMPSSFSRLDRTPRLRRSAVQLAAPSPLVKP